LPPSLPTPDERIDTAIAEWLEAEEKGQTLATGEFLARHPDIAGELQAFLADRRVFVRLASRVASAAGIAHSRRETITSGRRLGDFEIVREIGRGGMGTVYEARQISLKRSVALKVLHAGFGLEERAVARFHREAEAAARLHHASIVPVFATGKDAGVYFYAMELIEGPSLDRLIAQQREDRLKAVSNDSPDEASHARRRPPFSGSSETGEVPLPIWSGRCIDDFQTVARLMAHAADALEHAHAQGVIHRDIKPSNLLLAPDGRLRVGDFGLARIDEEPGLTQSGDVIGSPSYMSPEQAAGNRPLDHRTDVYSLGATLFELLTLRPPFAGKRRDEVLVKIIHNEPVLPRRINRCVPLDLETICLKSMEKDPGRRYQTAAEFSHDLHCFLDGRPIAARRPGPALRAWLGMRRRPVASALAAMVFVAAALAGYFAHSSRSSSERLAAVELEEAVDDALATAMSGDDAAAEQAIAQVAARGAETGWVPLLKGNLAYQRGDYDGAARHLEQAVELLPESVSARALLAAACVSAGWWEKYEQALDELDTLTPDSAEDFLFLGLAESYLDPVRGRQSLDEAIRRRRLPVAFVVRAEVCTNQAVDSGDIRDADAAVGDARLACQMLPDSPAALLSSLNAHLAAAAVYEDAGRESECAALMDQAARDAAALAPFAHLPTVANDRAMYLLDAGGEEEAAEILKDAAARNDNARVAYSYALLLYRRRAFAEAVAVLDRRTQLSDNEELLRTVIVMELPDGPERARAAWGELAARPSDGLAALFRPIPLLMLGDKAAAIAASRQLRARPVRFPRLRRASYERLLAFNCGAITADELLAAAGQSKWDQCEAHFFIGLSELADGNHEAAAEDFREAAARHCNGFVAQDWSDAFLVRRKADPQWPRWIPPRE
jgi:serine/threonine protein kinase/tetratricopeptide (TPR) repeat protein